MLKKIILPLICFGLLISSTAKTQYEPKDTSPNHFDQTLNQWLAHVGFHGSVLEYQKVYDNLGYIDYFRIMLQEGQTVETESDRKQAKILAEMTDNEEYSFAHAKIIDKDISNIPYMYFDWEANLAISYAIKKISKTLSLQAKSEKIRDGLYRVTIEPAKTTVPSRYRFTQIEIFYEVNDLFLNLDLTVKGPKDYLILAFYKSELHGILRALENGHFPGATSETLVSGLLKGTTNSLIRDLLKVPEAGHETLLELERNPSLTIEGWEPEH